MLIAHNSISSALCTFVLDTRIARETGYDGLALGAGKVRRYLAQGYSIQDAREVLDGLPVLGLGYVADVERPDPAGRESLLAEVENACVLAAEIGCSAVQLLTGPLDPMGAYSGPGDLPWPDLRRSTASNLAAIGQIGRSHGVSFYLEALAWAEIRTLPRVLEVIDAAEQDNIGLALDFWHLWNAGATPGEVAKLDGGLIRSVDFCDSLGPAGTRCGPDQAGRDVWTGGGAIPLSEWVAAVRATGYVGWWSCELLSPKYWELDPFETARELRELLLRLLA